MQAKELDPLLGILEKRLPENATLRETVREMMGACVGNLSWDEVRNPEFELPIESVGAYNALKAFVIEKGIVTPTEA